MALLNNKTIAVNTFLENDAQEQLASIIVESCDVAPPSPEESGNSSLQNIAGSGLQISTIVPGIAPAAEATVVADVKINDFINLPGVVSNIDITREIVDNPATNVVDTRGIKTDTVISEITTETRNSNGKRETYIVPDFIGPYFSTFIESNPVVDNNVYVADPFRGRMGFYWSLGDKQKEIRFLHSYDQVKIKTPAIQKRVILRNLIYNEANPRQFGFLEENFVVDFKGKRFITDTTSPYVSKTLVDAFAYGGTYSGPTIYSDEVTIEYAPTFTKGTKYLDFVFDKYLPYTKKELEQTSVPISSVTADITPDYNFYIEEYENLLKTVQVPENLLPNMYVILSEKTYAKSNPDFSKAITLGNKIKVSPKGILNSSKNAELNNDKGQYYDLYSRNYQKMRSVDIDKMNTKMKNLVVSKDDLDLITDFNSKKELFPMNISVRFSTDNTTKLCGVLAETNLTDIFVTKLVNKIIENSYKPISFIKETSSNTKSSENANYTTQTTISNSTNRAWDVNQFLQEIESQEIFEQLNRESATYLGDYESKKKSQNSEQNKFLNSLNVTIFRNKFTNILESKTRTMSQIFQGKKAYSETVLYRIAKYVGDSDFGEPIQNIFIPNDPALDVLEYIDTQVKYDQNYTYIIYSYDFVIGNEYEYVNAIDTNNNITKKILQTVTRPMPMLVETTLYTKTLSVLDKAPSPPEVQVAAYKDVDNKILIMLNSSVSQYKGFPIIINDSDIAKFNKLIKYQELDEGQKLTFGGDDRVSEFEIYRLDFKPRTYEEFNERLLRSLNTDYSLTSIQKASSAAFVDTIEPNKKYYYIFRSLDVHGNISNPTELLEVEIINENGTIFALINNVDFEKPNYKVPSRPIKRFIQIIPNVMQSFLDEESVGADINSAEQIKNNISLGILPSKIWGKKIKIRLVSNNTKKVVDFTVQFDHKNLDIVEK